MSFPLKNSDGARQLGLFGCPSLNILPRLKAAMRGALRTSSFSREQIADRMTELCRTHGIRPPGNAKAISRAMLEKWVAEGAAHVISLQALIAKELGVTDNLVWLTINGVEKNRRVIQWLQEHGCPEELLPAMRPEGRDVA